MIKSLLLVLTLLSLYAIDQHALNLLNDDNPNNDSDAISILKKQALSDKESAFLIATMYKNGIKVNQDITTAISWYLTAINLEDVDAMMVLAWLYYEGEKVTKNIELTKYYLNLASKFGSKEAEMFLKEIE